jgi:hypothetical protein
MQAGPRWAVLRHLVLAATFRLAGQASADAAELPASLLGLRATYRAPQSRHG